MHQMSTSNQTYDNMSAQNLNLLEEVILQGDLKNLTPHERVVHYKKVCGSLGLNPLTKPFDYISLNGKLTLYARKDATEQLRKLQNISIEIADRQLVDDIYVVTARAKNGLGRVDESIGAVGVSGLKGEAKANAFMKAETKAKRRVTLSIAGLGMLDESEAPSVPGARIETLDLETGEVLSEKKNIIVPIKESIQENTLEEIKSYMEFLQLSDDDLNKMLSAAKGKKVEIKASSTLSEEQGQFILNLLDDQKKEEKEVSDAQA